MKFTTYCKISCFYPRRTFAAKRNKGPCAGRAEIRLTHGLCRCFMLPPVFRRRDHAFPRALSTLSGVAGGSTHLPMALWMAMITRWVLARLWEMPLAP